MTDEKEQRKDAYTRGYEMALANVQTVISLGIEIHPAPMPMQTVGRIMNGKPELAEPILELLAALRKKIVADVKKKNGEAGTAAAA